MSHLKKSPRRRVNRFALVLSKEFQVSYEVADHVWAQMRHEVDKTVDVLMSIQKQVSTAEAELTQINTINLSF